MFMLNKTPLVSIALQGGGSHGAFTAGVLQRLHESRQFKLEGISGTSSGAVNACLIAYGNIAYGPSKKGVKPLINFWSDLGEKFNELFSSYDSVLPTYNNESSTSLSLQFFLNITKHFAPYQFNPEHMNPLRELLVKHIKFRRLRKDKQFKLFIAATNNRTSKLKMFETAELTPEHILASACLPSLHHSIEINGESYWDGAFSANPAIFPLIFNCKSPDIIIVQVQPLEYDDIPASPEKIRERIGDIAFASNFKREMRALAFTKRYIKNNLFQLGKLDRKVNNTRIHFIHADDYIKQLNPDSRYNASPDFLTNLQKAGYECADKWLENNLDNIGKRSSINLEQMFE